MLLTMKSEVKYFVVLVTMANLILHFMNDGLKMLLVKNHVNMKKELDQN